MKRLIKNIFPILMLLFLFFSFEKDVYSVCSKSDDLFEVVEHFKDYIEGSVSITKKINGDEESLKDKNLILKNAVNDLSCILAIKTMILDYEKDNTKKNNLLHSLLKIRFRMLVGELKIILEQKGKSSPLYPQIVDKLMSESKLSDLDINEIMRVNDYYQMLNQLIKLALYLPGGELSRETELYLNCSVTIHNFLLSNEIGNEIDAPIMLSMNSQMMNILPICGFG